MTTDLSGALRYARSGDQLTAYYLASGNGVPISTVTASADTDFVPQISALDRTYPRLL